MKSRQEEGFTLIELLTIIMIIGILAQIALSQFEAYKRRAYNANAQSDLKNIMSAQEAYYFDNAEYADSVSDFSTVEVSEGVQVVLVRDTDVSNYYVAAYHEAGSMSYCYAVGMGTNPGQIREFHGANNLADCP